MGWNPFKSKKKISVSSATVNLAGDKPKPIFMRKVIFNATVANRDTASTITGSLVQGPGNKLRKYYRYGRDHYISGLPYGAITAPKMDSSKCEEVIEKTTGQDIMMVQFNAGTWNPDFPVMKYMAKHYGYDPETGHVENLPDGVSEDADFSYEIVRPTSQSEEVLVLTFKNPDETEVSVTTDIDVNITLSDNYVMMAFRFIKAETIETDVEERERLPTDTESFSTNTQKQVTDNAQIIYKTVTVTTEFYEEDVPAVIKKNPDGTEVVEVEPYTKQMTRITTETRIRPMSNLQVIDYRVGSGLYPEIDSYYKDASLQETSDYFPIVYFRQWNRDMFHPDHKNEWHELHKYYKSAKKLLNVVGIDAIRMRNSINENPDIGDINHAYMIIGVPLNSKEQASKRYLFEYFKAISPLMTYTKDTFLHGPAWQRWSKNEIKMYQESFDVSIRFNFANVTRKVGRIGKIGHCTVHKGEKVEDVYYDDPIYDENGNLVTENKNTVEYGAIYFRKQITNNVYEEVEVVGLTHTNYIYKGHNADNDGWNVLDNPDNDAFIIPLVYSIQQKVNLSKFTQLSTDCYHMVFNAYKETKVKWYQSGLFKAITVVVAVVAIAYGGWAFTTGLMEAVAAASTAGTSIVGAVTSYIATSAAISIGIAVGLNELSKIVGVEGMLLIAAVMTAYAFASYGSVMSGATSNKGLPFAQELLSTVPAVINAGNNQLKRDYALFQKEVEEFQSYSERKDKEMQEAWDSLGSQVNMLDYDSFIRATNLQLFETPELFFSRTLNPTIGTLSTSVVSTYVQNAIRLPRSIEDL